MIKLLSPMNLQNYWIKSFETKELNKNDFVYCKNFLLNNTRIITNNLTIVKKATDYEIFRTLESKLTDNINLYEIPVYSEIKEIKINNEISINCLISKVVLKIPQQKLRIIIDSSKRIIKLLYEMFENLELFDLLLIINCKIKKSRDNNYSYDLILSNFSIKYSTKNLFFDKRIILNNFTIFNINFPDYQIDDNYYDIIISDTKIKVN